MNIKNKETDDEEIKEVVRGFIDLVNAMRNPTEEEKESVNKYIESISKPTGVNIFDLMDEPLQYKIPIVFPIPDACKNCLNHPSNGGTGICFCTLATPKIT